MDRPEKGSSPFFPGQPVPPELFVGRIDQIDWLMRRGARQVASGKPVTVFVEGEYGIGKSSIAKFVSWLADEQYDLLTIYATVGGARSIDDVSTAVLEATVRTGVFEPNKRDKLRNWLGTYVGNQRLFGLNVNLEAIKRDAPQLSSPYGMLAFLQQACDRLGDDESRGIFLILDELNGITSHSPFSHFIKAIVDTNAMSKTPLPLLLMLCGTGERRREMIDLHPPLDRVFDVVQINPLSRDDTRAFFSKAFASAGIAIDGDALKVFSWYSAGFPKLMHEIGDAAFWKDQDGTIDHSEAMEAVFDAADTIMRKYVDNQIIASIRSEDYQSILQTIAAVAPSEFQFTRAQVVEYLEQRERNKVDQCLKRLRNLGVIKQGEIRGQYEWTNPMVRLALWLDTLRKNPERIHRTIQEASP